MIEWMTTLAFAFTPLLSIPPDVDTDKDGLSDFQEEHKYRTDPRKADSDGDGIGDGDWFERREFAYTVRSVVHVMKPVTIDTLNDDYQDARLLDETSEHAELEVIHYPFNSVASAIVPDSGWRKPDRNVKPWLKPGFTSDWTPKLRKDLLEALEADDIHIDKLDDKQVVEQVSAWLMDHAKYFDGFSSFITAFDEQGRPFIPDELSERAERGVSETQLSLEEQWEREISASGMFEQGIRGSCTSSAIYISGCLRAIGIPTRTVLCIPLIDASDPKELALAEDRLSHPKVRRIVLESAKSSPLSWTSHTFNEVFVGGRWRRLNYSKLGQNILDSHFLGLMTHVGTFDDWADARMPETVGRRQSLGIRHDLFGGSNPYSTISLRDEFGPHCTMERPETQGTRLTVSAVHWTDAPELPKDIVEGCKRSGRFGLIAVIEDLSSSKAFTSFLDKADTRVFLEAEEVPRLGVHFERGCSWFKNGTVYAYLPFGGADRRDLRDGVSYRVEARNGADHHFWDIDLEVTR